MWDRPKKPAEDNKIYVVLDAEGVVIGVYKDKLIAQQLAERFIGMCEGVVFDQLPSAERVYRLS